MIEDWCQIVYNRYRRYYKFFKIFSTFAFHSILQTMFISLVILLKEINVYQFYAHSVQRIFHHYFISLCKEYFLHNFAIKFWKHVLYFVKNSFSINWYKTRFDIYFLFSKKKKKILIFIHVVFPILIVNLSLKFVNHGFSLFLSVYTTIFLLAF